MELTNNPASNLFYETLEREGIVVRINDAVETKVFFRIDNKGDKTPYINIFSTLDSSIIQGDLLTINNEKYLALKNNTVENNIYQKTQCVKCNQSIKYMLRHLLDTNKADLTLFDGYGEDISESLKINSNVTTPNSKGHFILPLNDLTKRININDRFYAGGTKLAWKVTDIIYQNNVTEIDCCRDLRDAATDDLVNGIADRWRFESKPKTYKLDIAESIINIDDESSAVFNYTIYEDNTLLDPTPQASFVSSDNSIAIVDSDTATITGIKEGTCSISGSYKVNPNDIAISDSVNVEVTHKEPITPISVAPPYDNTDYYKVKQNRTVTFTCSCGNNPNWNITLNANGNTASLYTSSIDNNAGTFTVKSLGASSNYLIYTITDTVSNQSINYNIKLASAF